MALTEQARTTIQDLAGARKPTKPYTALTTNPTAAPAGGTGATAGAYDTAANRNTMIACVNGLRTRVAEIEAILEDLGLLP